MRLSACMRAKGCRRALKLLVGDQALDQDLAQGIAVKRAELLKVFVELVIVVIDFARGLLRHQRGGLDVQKGLPRPAKVARHVQVQRLDALGLGRYCSATSLIEMAPISTFWRVTSCSSRSNGPL